MYGFRGRKYNVDLLSAFQMCMHWECVEIKHPDYRCPKNNREVKHSVWTKAGIIFRDSEKKDGKRQPEYIPGEHYTVIDTENRIVLPELPNLRNLQHSFMWIRRRRPCVPIWSYAKIPKTTLSPNENARLLNVYMRPWTLNPEDANDDNRLLSDLAFCKYAEETDVQRMRKINKRRIRNNLLKHK